MYDIILLCETGRQIPAADAIPGYTLVHACGGQQDISSNNGTRHMGGGRGQGRAAFVRNPLARYVKLNRHDQCVDWFQFHIAHSQYQTQQLFIGLVYMPPVNSTFWQGGAYTAQGVFESLTQDIAHYKHNGSVLVLGDFNAHTAGLNDTSSDSSQLLQDLGLGGDYDTVQPAYAPRSNLDIHRPCQQGRRLIQCCLDSGCVLLNGRAPGDPQGLHTYYYCGMPNGCLDYGICDASLFHNISNFQVLPIEPSSDHCPLACAVQLHTTHINAVNGEVMHNIHAQDTAGGNPVINQPVLWDQELRDSYVAALQQPHVLDRLQQISRDLESGSTDTCTAADTLTDLLYNTAKGVFGVAKSNTRYLPGNNRTAKKWFKHCKQEWSNLKAAIRRGDTHAADQYRREFNRVKRRWQRRYNRQAQAKMMDDLLHNPRKFWSGFKGKRACLLQADMRAIQNYWAGLYGGTGRGALSEHMTDISDMLGDVLTSNAHITSSLNADFSEAEVEVALSKLHRGRAAGPDGLKAEILKSAYTEDEHHNKTYILVPYLTCLFNHVFKSGQYPSQWSKATISPVYKKGDASDLDNYRGIAVGSLLGKLYAVLIDNRLSKHAEQHSWRAEGQAGFRPKRSTIDHVFVLRHLIDKFRFGQGRRYSNRLYCCFVDFHKAYDSVRRDLLVKRLNTLGMYGNMLNAIIQMYRDVMIVPKQKQCYGTPIDSTCGVKQGDPLSPLLFGLFIDELEQYLQQRLPQHGVQCGTKLVQLLLYADDLALLSATPDGLQQQLHVLSSFCEDKGLEVNLSKTEIVVFGRRRWLPDSNTRPWMYRGQIVRVSEQFKYLGVTLHSTKGVSAAVNVLATAGSKASFALNGRFRSMGMMDLVLKLRMFDTVVSPILTYCSEVWAPDLLTGFQSFEDVLNNPLERVHMAFLRNLGYLPQSVSRVILLRELGAHSLSRAWISLCVNFWNRMVALPDDCLLKQALLDDIDLTLTLRQNRRKVNTWYGKFASTLLSLIPYIPTEGPRAHILRAGIYSGCMAWNGTPIALNVAEVLKAWGKLEESPWSDLPINPRHTPTNNGGSLKLATYHRWFAVPIKSTRRTHRMRYWDLPQYVLHSSDLNGRQLSHLMKFRLGIHHLHIESGRWTKPKTPRQQRLCSKCTMNVIEDEYHFVFECQAYQHIRARHEQLFECVGGSQVCGSNATQGLDMITFMDKQPKAISRFLEECYTTRDDIGSYLPYHDDLAHLDLFDSESDID